VPGCRHRCHDPHACRACGCGGAAETISIDIGDTFRSPYLSNVCGTDVFVQVTGTLRVTLWRNAEGDVVRELDRTPASRLVFRAPATGGTFSTPNATVTTYDYGAGAAIGSAADVRIRGEFGRVTGFIPADAGVIELHGTVVAFDEFGIPIVDFPDTPTRETGNREAGRGDRRRDLRGADRLSARRASKAEPI
jgi:hypothetical protein